MKWKNQMDCNNCKGQIPCIDCFQRNEDDSIRNREPKEW